MSAEPALGELIAGQRRVPALFDENRTPIALFTLEGICVAANRAASLYLSESAQDLTGARLRDLIGDQHRRASDDVLGRVSLGEHFSLPSVLRGANRRARVEIEFTPAHYADRIVGAYLSWHDLGEDDLSQREIERRLHEVSALFEHSLDAMIAIDLRGRITAANPATFKLLGYKADELIGRHYQSLLAPQALERASAMFSRVLEGRGFEDSTVLLHRDGSYIETEGTLTPIVVDERVLGVYTVGRDVTDRRRDEASSREQAERIHELCRVAASSGQSNEEQIQSALELGMRRLKCDGAYITSVKGGNVTHRHVAGTGSSPAGSVRPLAQSIHRQLMSDDATLAIDDFSLPPWNDDVSRRFEREGKAFIGASLMLEGVPYGTVAFVAREARTGERFTEADRDFVRLIGALAATAIERGEQRRRLDTLAYFDALTGLPNRTLLHDRLEETISHAKRRARSFAVHFIDLDGFKFVNDHHGHPHGDQVLRGVAQRLTHALRKSDIVARLGGDEFVVLQPEISRAGEALEVAGRLREVVSAPILVGTHEHRLGCSIGIALFPGDGADAATLLARADAALYSVKANGRNGVAFASPPK